MICKSKSAAEEAVNLGLSTRKAKSKSMSFVGRYKLKNKKSSQQLEVPAFGPNYIKDKEKCLRSSGLLCRSGLYQKTEVLAESLGLKLVPYLPSTRFASPHLMKLLPRRATIRDYRTYVSTLFSRF